MSRVRECAGLIVLLSLLALSLVPVDAHATRIPLTMWYNNPTSSAVVQDADGLSSNSIGRAEVIGIKGDLANGAYVGGGAGNTYASATSDLIHGAGASGDVCLNWNSVFYIDADDNVDLYLDLQMNAFGGDSAFGVYAHAAAYVKADIMLYTAKANVHIYENVFIWEDAAFVDETIFLGKVPDFSSYPEYVGLCLVVDIVSAAQTISVGTAMARNAATFDFELWADDPDLPDPAPVPEPASLLLGGFGLLGLTLLRRRLSSGPG